MTTTPYAPNDIAAAVARGQAAANDGPPAGSGRRPRRPGIRRHGAGVPRQGWEHLEQGDMDQASKKGWKLVAETVKAISAHYGSVIHTHRAIAEVVGELARLAGDAGDAETRRRINRSFAVARGLHTNFYENEMQEDTVRDGLEACEELSQLLYLLFWPEGAAVDVSI